MILDNLDLILDIKFDLLEIIIPRECMILKHTYMIYGISSTHGSVTKSLCLGRKPTTTPTIEIQVQIRYYKYSIVKVSLYHVYLS